MATAPPLVGKLVYRFEEGDATQRKLLGGKGSNLCEMAHLGLPVPPGFVITTQVCQSYFSSGPCPRDCGSPCERTLSSWRVP